jgi:hypothetical protein
MEGKGKGKGKGKVHPRRGHEGPEGECTYSSTLALTSALDGTGGQHHAPAALPPGKTRYPLYRGLGGPQSRSGQVRKISPPPGFDPRAVRPVASRYTDWAIPAPRIGNYPGQNEAWLRSTDYLRQARDIHERVLVVNESI